MAEFTRYEWQDDSWKNGQSLASNRNKRPSLKSFVLALFLIGATVVFGLRIFGLTDKAAPVPLAADANLLKNTLSEWDTHKPKLSRITDHIRTGETLSGALMRYDLSNQDVRHLVQALKKDVNMRTIRAGDVFVLEHTVDLIQGKSKNRPISAFELIHSNAYGLPIRYRAERTSAVDRISYNVKRIETPVTTRHTSISGHIENSLYDSMLSAGADSVLINRFADVFNWQIDFYRKSRRDDSFKVIAEELVADGRTVGYGRVLAAEYAGINGIYRGFYFQSQDGAITGVFDDKGKSLEKSFLISPLEVARVSSRYGQRFHPVLRLHRKHNGIDYGAAIGTPFWAVADGMVIDSRRSLTAGNMIRIKHRNGYITEYFHASRIHPKVHRGTFVKQRQIIGYVGQTGMATGPHLHYAMKKETGYVDPGKQKFTGGPPIPAKYMRQYLQKIEPIRAQLTAMKT